MIDDDGEREDAIDDTDDGIEDGNADREDEDCVGAPEAVVGLIATPATAHALVIPLPVHRPVCAEGGEIAAPVSDCAPVPPRPATMFRLVLFDEMPLVCEVANPQCAQSLLAIGITMSVASVAEPALIPLFPAKLSVGVV